jgi:plasmid stabilization system protein ParE
MSYRIRILARARDDLDAIVTYISERSPEGAARLVARYEEALATLEVNPFVASIAPESDALGEEVRHLLFRTRAGRTYRALFVIVGDEVRVLRVRGPGQRPVRPEDITPEG